jgi:hypothetical protein
MVEKECPRKGQAGYSGDERESCINEPDNAERLNLAGVAFELELEAGYWRDWGGDRTAALGAECLP